MQLFTARTLLKAMLALAAGGPIAGRASAQAYPTHLLRLVVPFSAGAGILDIMARLISQRLSAGLGQQVVVDNKPGAGGNVGSEIVAKAAPEGYTLLIAGPALVVSPFLYAHLDFDPMADFVGVTMINSAPLLLVVHPSLPVKSVAELIAYAKANPGKLNYGSGGVGATPYLAVELLKSMASFDAVHVPYRGGAPALADLVAGQLSFMIENVPGTLPFVKDGKLRALAITSRERSSLVPDLPTMIEAGVPGYEMIGWNGIFVPKGTGPKIVERLHGELAEILRGAELREQFAKLGAEAVGNTPVAFAAFVKEESTRWGKIIRDRGIKPE
jgi:tripartite-type tricarboxylate transporter receptor subunit TctC